MKNKISIILILSTFVIFIIGGCTKSWLDVNDDPNNAKEASYELVFPSGVVSAAAHIGGYYELVGGFWSQYWSQSNSANQYKYLDLYQINSSDFNGNWREVYCGALSDLQYAIDDAKEKNNTTYYLMGTVMQAYVFQFMTDMHGDIPYSEAFQGDAEVQNFNPRFDSQESIYTDLLARIDEAMNVEEFSELTDAQANADFVFGGDVEQWIKFANTLKLKMYLRLAYVQPSVAQAGIEKLYADGAEFLSSDAGLNIFIDQETKDNPLYASDKRNLNVATNLRVSTTLFRYYEQNSDPRMDYILESNSNPMPQGGFNIPSTALDPTTVCVFALYPTTPVFFISLVESYLLQAEAIERGWGSGDAKLLYDMAIAADFSRKGLSGYEDLIAEGGVYEYPTSGTFDEKLEAIIMAKWAAFAGLQGAEAFFERNRTGYPKESSVPAWTGSAYNDDYVGGYFTYSLEGTTGGIFPKRMIYPQDEINLNTSCPPQTSVKDPVWWDVN